MQVIYPSVLWVASDSLLRTAPHVSVLCLFGIAADFMCWIEFYRLHEIPPSSSCFRAKSVRLLQELLKVERKWNLCKYGAVRLEQFSVIAEAVLPSSTRLAGSTSRNWPSLLSIPRKSRSWLKACVISFFNGSKWGFPRDEVFQERQINWKFRSLIQHSPKDYQPQLSCSQVTAGASFCLSVALRTFQSLYLFVCTCSCLQKAANRLS